MMNIEIHNNLSNSTVKMENVDDDILLVCNLIVAMRMGEYLDYESLPVTPHIRTYTYANGWVVSTDL